MTDTTGGTTATTAAGNGPDGEPGSDVHRRQCVGAYMTVQGLPRNRAEEQYERQLAEWRASQGDGGNG